MAAASQWAPPLYGGQPASDMFQVARGAAAGVCGGLLARHDEQWVDGLFPPPPSLPPPAATAARGAVAATGTEQMLFRWVDCPGYGRAVHPAQLYQQMPMPLYFDGIDPMAPYSGSALGALGQGVMQGPGTMVLNPVVRQSGTPQGDATQRGGDAPRRQQRQAPSQGGCQGPSGGSGGVNKRSAQPPQVAEAAPRPSSSATGEEVGSEAAKDMLIGTLESIYKDRIKPMGNYVKGRLKERECHDSVVRAFVDYFKMFPQLFTVQEPANAEDVQITFVTEPDWFKGWVDIDSPNDPYDESMWQEFAAFLNGEHTFAGGRYGMARELMQRNLPFLAPYSLGEICHIVQLAITPRKLILYHRKMLKPIQSIMGQTACGAGGGIGSGAAVGSEVEVSSMDQLLLILFRMSIRYPQGIQLSRMKQIIKREFSCTISEMAFQCTKLSELFGREPLSSIFLLEIKDSGKSMYVRMKDYEPLQEAYQGMYDEAKNAELKMV